MGSFQTVAAAWSFSFLSQLLETPPGSSESIFSSHKGRKVPMCYFPIAWNVWHLASTMFYHTMLTLKWHLHHCYDSHKFIGYHCLINWSCYFWFFAYLFFFACHTLIWWSGLSLCTHSATFSISQWRWWTNSSLPSVRKYLTHAQESQAFRKWFLKYPNVNKRRIRREKPIQYTFDTHELD